MNDRKSTLENSQPDRLVELVAARIAGDLTDDEKVELQGYDQRTINQLQLEFEHVTACLEGLSNHEKEQLPQQLQNQIMEDARVYFSKDEITPTSNQGSLKINRREIFAWTSLAICLFLLFSQQNWQESNGLTPELARNELIKKNPNSIQVDWQPGIHPFSEEVTGDVVWDNQSQQGYMRFVNMPINDATVNQYQLWIIDADRDSNPIDGGVFDINDAGEVVIPINAKLNVISPDAFAITIEKPGGVVVSSQNNLPLIAPVKT